MYEVLTIKNLFDVISTNFTGIINYEPFGSKSRVRFYAINGMVVPEKMFVRRMTKLGQSLYGVDE